MARFLVSRPLKTCVLLAAIFAVRFSTGANVTMVWDPSPSTNVAAYRVYYGTASRVYASYAQVSAPATNIVIANLTGGTTYYFGATGVDSLGVESAFSNEATYTPTATAGTAPTANSSTVSTLEDTPANVTLSGTSGSGNTLAYTIKTTPASGTLTGIAPNLVYTPNANFFGTDQFTFSVSDGVGTASATVSITVTAVNDPPTLDVISSRTINEDAGTQTVSLTGITAGPANETGQTISVTASSSNSALIPNPVVTYTSPNSAGTLTFTPIANAYGSATITVTVKDNQVANNTITRTFTVTVNAVNDPPTLNAPTAMVLRQNPGPQVVQLTGIGSGAANESQTLTVTATTSNSSLIAPPVVSYTSPSSSGTLTFTPVTNATGSATISVTVKDGGSTNNSITRTFSVLLNNPPTLDAIGNRTVNEDTTTQVALSGITAGAANESAQVVTVTATSSNPAVVPNPTVSYVNPNTTGTLTITPVANASGTSTISVIVNDGQSGNNTTTRTFTVTVNAVNDPPTLNSIANVTLDSNGGSKAISLSGITSGASNESQTLAVTALSSNTSLLTTAVSYTSPNSTGTLTLTPVVGKTGTVTVTATVSDGINTVSRPFTVTLVAPPKISNLTVSATDARTLKIAWNTDKTATCYVENGTNSMVNLDSPQTSGTSHSVTLTNLEANTLYYLRVNATAGGSSSTQVATVTTRPAFIVSVAAEDGILTGSYKVVSSTAAENGAYISTASGSATASYSLALQQGPNYRVWARVKTPAGGASFSLSFDGVSDAVFAGDKGATNQWHWVLLAHDSNRTIPAEYSLNTATHSLTLNGATGVLLDEFVILNDPAWQPIFATVGPTLTVTRTSTTTAALAWVDPSDDASAYGIEYSADGINFSPCATVAAPSTSLNVGNLAARTYYFRVYAYNTVDRSAYSNVAVALY